ncbi:MAG: VWA domain-containing protein [Myxococcales bacterium]|nr:VWA domain-containing protein [Myxococcales bacterium]MCB9549630.1 VWA domain-containing protein [Myxococcales bacterium]
MLRPIGSVFLAMFLLACGDGPDWTRNPDDLAGPRPGGEAPPGDGPVPVDRTPNPWSPDRPDPEPGTPARAPDEGLELLTVWGEGLDVEVDSLSWGTDGEIRFRIGLTESETGKPAAAVGADQFGFAEDGVKLGSEALYDVQRGKDLEVILVLDLSQSIVEARALEAVKDGARTLFETLPREARVAVVGFSTEYELLTDFTDDSRTVHAIIDALTPREGRDGRFTNLWGALDYAAGLFDDAREDTGRVVVVFTDGRDNVAERDLPAAMDAVSLAGARTFAIGLGSDFDADGLGRLAGPGHVTSTQNPAGLAALFGDIATLIGERLTVTYVTPKSTGTHTLSVDVNVGNRAGGFDLRFTLP